METKLSQGSEKKKVALVLSGGAECPPAAEAPEAPVAERRVLRATEVPGEEPGVELRLPECPDERRAAATLPDGQGRLSRCIKLA